MEEGEAHQQQQHSPRVAKERAGLIHPHTLGGLTCATTTAGGVGLVYMVSAAPKAVPYTYLVIQSAMLSYRFLSYYRSRWHHFCLDLCYFVNLLLMVYIVAAPGSQALFVTVFALSAIAMLGGVVFNNSLAFHDVQKVISCSLHILPMLVCHTLRWKPALRRFRKCSDAETCEGYNSFLLHWVAPVGVWIVHAILYHAYVNMYPHHKLRAQEGYTNSFLFLRSYWGRHTRPHKVRPLPDTQQHAGYTCNNNNNNNNNNNSSNHQGAGGRGWGGQRQTMTTTAPNLPTQEEIWQGRQGERVVVVDLVESPPLSSRGGGAGPTATPTKAVTEGEVEQGAAQPPPAAAAAVAEAPVAAPGGKQQGGDAVGGTAVAGAAGGGAPSSSPNSRDSAASSSPQSLSYRLLTCFGEGRALSAYNLLNLAFALLCITAAYLLFYSQTLHLLSITLSTACFSFNAGKFYTRKLALVR